MTALEQVEDAIAAGALRRPTASTPSFVDVATAVLVAAGAPLPPSPHSRLIAGLIGEPRHLLFVLVDGMGSYVTDQLAATGAIRAGIRTQLDAVFPATTACAMTTLATATWPGQHGVPGWHGYLAERDIATTVLKFEERFAATPLQKLGVAPADLWPLHPCLRDAARDVCVILPAPIAQSTYSAYQTGGRQTRPYNGLGEVVGLIKERLAHSGPAFTYCYLPEFDALCHEHGALSEPALATLHFIDALIDQLRNSLPSDACMLISADHGLLDVAAEDVHLVQAHDPLMSQLRTAPAGEPRTPHLFVRDGQIDSVREQLNAAMAGRFAFLTQREAEQAALFGPGGLSTFARRRFGDLIGMALQPATFELARPLPPGKSAMRGRHGGMTPEEVRVPLAVY
jgi:hypothetical protein